MQSINTRRGIMYPMCKKATAMNAQFRCNVNSKLCIRLPLLFYVLGPKQIFRKLKNSNMAFIGCVSKHILLFQLLILSSRPLQTFGNILEISIAGWKCLCVSRSVVLWTKHLDIILYSCNSHGRIYGYMTIWAYGIWPGPCGHMAYPHMYSMA